MSTAVKSSRGWSLAFAALLLLIAGSVVGWLCGLSLARLYGRVLWNAAEVVSIHPLDVFYFRLKSAFGLGLLGASIPLSAWIARRPARLASRILLFTGLTLGLVLTMFGIYTMEAWRIRKIRESMTFSGPFVMSIQYVPVVPFVAPAIVSSLLLAALLAGRKSPMTVATPPSFPSEQGAGEA